VYNIIAILYVFVAPRDETCIGVEIFRQLTYESCLVDNLRDFHKLLVDCRIVECSCTLGSSLEAFRSFSLGCLDAGKSATELLKLNLGFSSLLCALFVGCESERYRFRRIP